jgi:predicted enzyme related to lactoylglutathione lyase
MDVATSNWPALGGADLADATTTPSTIEVGVVVRDVSAMVEFYRAALGCEVFGRFEAPGVQLVAVSFGNSIVKLFQREGDIIDPEARGFESLGIQYMTFKVSDVDRAFEKVLAAGGVAVSEPSDANPACTYALLRDVEGNLIELVQGAPW